MKVLKQMTNEYYDLIETGILHPVDGTPVEFRLIIKYGAYAVFGPCPKDPDYGDEIEINHEPSDPSEQNLLDSASPYQIAVWAVGDIKPIYAKS